MANNDALPEGYKEGVARVSNVVSFKYPFGGYGKANYLKWLEKNNIHEPVYMKEAQDVGTFIHLQMENFIDRNPLDVKEKLFSNHRKEIDNGIEYFSKLLLKYPEVDWHTEVVVCDNKNRYQGSIDLVRIDEKNKKVWLYDWKTWGIAKKRFNLPNELKKPTDKLKKVALQLSLYAETYRQKGYEIGGIYVVWLHEEECVEYSLRADAHRQKFPHIRLWETEEIDELLDNYFSSLVRLPSDIILNINLKEMKIEIQTPIPNVDFSKASIILEEDDFKNPADGIAQAVKLQKELLEKYKK